MKSNRLLRSTAALAFSLCTTLGSHAAITALNGGTQQWATAEWTAGVPGPTDTAFLNDNTEVTVGAGTTALAQGIRMGNNTSATSRLVLADGTLSATFIVIGDAPNSNAEFVQSGGVLSVQNTKALDFEIGNPANAPTDACFANAVFKGGESSLADLRFNLRPFRETKLSVVGSKARINAASLTAEVNATESWTIGVLDFTFDAAGVSSIILSGNLALSEGKQFDLQVDGSAYKGTVKRFLLIDAAAATGTFHNIELKGFRPGAKVTVENGDVVLTIP